MNSIILFIVIILTILYLSLIYTLTSFCIEENYRGEYEAEKARMSEFQKTHGFSMYPEIYASTWD